MITIKQNFQQIYQPHKAFLVFKSMADKDITYVESYDIAPSGRPINAHPLTTSESIDLARSLAESKGLNTKFLQPKGILPEHLLYTSLDMDGYAIWYTSPQQVNLRFSPFLGIANGLASVPAMIWKADKSKLRIFAFRSKGASKPDLETELFHAPFFNIYDSGKVCMGTVNVNLREGIFLEDFISAWESYFFNSDFSHTILGHVSVKTNIVQLWKKLVDSPLTAGQKKQKKITPRSNELRFPESVMKSTGRKLQDLIR